MRSGWRRIKLRDVCQVHHGWAFPSDNCRPPIGDAPRLIRIGDFAQPYGSDFRPELVQEYTGVYPERFRLAPGDLLIAMTCQTRGGEILGVPMRVPDDGVQYLHNQRIGRVEVTAPDVVDVDFLTAVMSTPAFNRHLFASASGSAILHTAPDRILTFEFDLPPLELQRQIVAVLGAIDDLIVADLELADSAERAWRAAVSAALDASQERVKLSDVALFVNGRNFTKAASGDGRPVIRTPELRRGPTATTVWNDIETGDEHVARRGDILFVWSGSLMVARWLYEDGLVNQHIFKVIPKQSFPAWLALALVERQMAWFLGLAADKATTMGHIQRRHLDAEVPLPSRQELERLTTSVEPLWELGLEAAVEALEMRALRQALMPLLLDGRVVPGEVAA